MTIRYQMSKRGAMETRKYTITRTRVIHDCRNCDYHSCYMSSEGLECSCHHPDLPKILESIEFKGERIPITSKGVETGEGFPEWCPL